MRFSENFICGRNQKQNSLLFNSTIAEICKGTNLNLLPLDRTNIYMKVVQSASENINKFTIYMLDAYLTTFRPELQGPLPEDLGDQYTGLAAKTIHSKNLMSEESMSLLLCLKYISVLLIHFSSSKNGHNTLKL